MAEKVLVELPEDLVQQARTVAERTRRSVDEVLVDWIRRAGAEPVLELLPDDDLLTLCDSQLAPELEEALSDLLDRNREGTLSAKERDRLAELMQQYRATLIRKAQALRVAVHRGLRPRLS